MGWIDGKEVSLITCSDDSMLEVVPPEPVRPPPSNPNRAPRLSRPGMDLLKHFEGFAPRFYRDPVGIQTIGYGHACHAFDCRKLIAKSSSRRTYEVHPPLSKKRSN